MAQLSFRFDMLPQSVYEPWKNMKISFNQRELKSLAESSNAHATVATKGYSPR
jgi:hypothetical protein